MIVAVCGMEREARIAAGAGVVTVVGGSSGRLRERLESALAGARGVISIGIAGALSPQLRSGDFIVAAAILAPAKRFAVDSAWLARLVARLPGATLAPIAGTNVLVATAAEEARMFDATGAYAADMESHIAAEVAESRGLPFAGLRIVADAATSDLPACASVALTPEGKVSLAAVLGSVVKRPGQIPQALRMARESNLAFAALFRCRALLGDRLLGPDLL
jgi:adenosylhomocysteine nucleosidase